MPMLRVPTLRNCLIAFAILTAAVFARVAAETVEVAP